MTAIDVIIPVWNRADSVGRAIDSALSQGLPAGSTLAVTVIDDGSSDHLAETLRAFDPHVTCIRHARNRGPAAARNTGIAASRADYIAFLDSDDTWLPDKLLQQIDFMRTHDHVASCTSFLLVRPDRTEIKAPSYPTGALDLADLAWGCFVSPGSTLICKRDVYRQISDYDVALHRLEDWDWLLRYGRLHRLGFLGQPLARIEASHSPNVAEALAAIDCIEQKHLNNLPARERRRFRAATALVRAATLHRKGSRLAAAAALIKSLWIAPVANAALTTVMHNRFARR
jgi:glycosyltransferase involved in cell wall biosynthesis